MSYFRNSRIRNPFSLLLATLMLNLSMYSCQKGSVYIDDNMTSQASVFLGEAIETVTGADGMTVISTNLISQGNEYNLTYDFRIQNEAGEPVEGITIGYNQINEKSIIFIHDENERYASTFFIATPGELQDYFMKGESKTGPYLGIYKRDSTYESSEADKAVITATIILAITVIAIGAAQVGFFMNAYKVQEFLLTDYVSHGEDYILYCKTFEDIAGLIKARTNMVLNLTSIFIAFIGAGASSASLVVELTNALGSAAVSTIRDELYGHAIDTWGVHMDQLIGRRVPVKVFPYEEHQSFSNVRNLFAKYTIEYDNAICDNGEGTITGVVYDATNNNPIPNVKISLSGQGQDVTYTNHNGSYSFEGIGAGNYILTAEKSNYTTESRDLSFDGSFAQVNFVMNPSTGADEYRIVLTWGSEPLDLDLHLITENGDHIYWNNKGSLTSYPYIFLDHDERYGYGPETITIKQLQASEIFVHNFSGSPDIKQSQAVVNVYNDDTLIRSYNVPSSGTGLWWHVFDINNNGVITDQDYLFNWKMELKGTKAE